jgi:GNAT superfamily N-acetyltransferase
MSRDVELAHDLQELSAKLVRVQEQERRHIARELHDEIGQALTAIKVELAYAQRSIEDAQGSPTVLETARAITDGALHQVSAFAQVERDGDAAEITQVYVQPVHRGGGRGAALVRGAIEAAGRGVDLWINADDEDRAKDLYARLGFRPVWTAMEFLRVP